MNHLHLYKIALLLLVYIKSKLQVLSFMFVPNCRRRHLPSKLTSYVFNVSKYCNVCPLSLTQLIFIACAVCVSIENFNFQRMVVMYVGGEG
ncbi:hypothetical protein Hanom_Chr16g01520261 [Helianthus anomalus]